MGLWGGGDINCLLGGFGFIFDSSVNIWILYVWIFKEMGVCFYMFFWNGWID